MSGAWMFGAPDVDGFYWMRQDQDTGHGAPEVCRVLEGGKFVLLALDDCPLQEARFFSKCLFWSEPLEPPQVPAVLVLGPRPDHVDSMRYCPVCSEANGMKIVHIGPACEPGKPAFDPRSEE